MYDVYVAEAMMENDYQNFNTPEKKEALINEVFKKHKTNQAQWDTSLSWYSDKIDIYLRMNDSVKTRIQRQQKATEQLVNRQIAEEQSITARSYSPSYIPRAYSFDETTPKNGFHFRLDTAEIAKRINQPDFDFAFSVMGIPANSTPNLRAMLMLEYKDTTLYRTELITENREYALHAQKYILNDTIQHINGFVRLQDTIGRYKNIRLNKISLGSPNDFTSQSQDSTSMHPERMLLRENLQTQ